MKKKKAAIEKQHQFDLLNTQLQQSTPNHAAHRPGNT